jgi:hypothetical protein
LVNVASEKTVTDFAWAVAMRGRVGCGIEDQARWYRSGWNGGSGVMVAWVGFGGGASAGMEDGGGGLVIVSFLWMDWGR